MANPLTPQRLYAWFFIGFHGIKGWILRALRPEQSGLDAFKQNYVQEGLPPVPADVRARYHEFVRCTACGACDAVCPMTKDADPLEWQGPMTVVLSMARAAPHYAEALPALRHFEQCGTCRACERVCPEHIPIRDVGMMMLQALSAIEANRPRDVAALPAAVTPALPASVDTTHAHATAKKAV